MIVQVLTVPMPSMAKSTVEKKSGSCARLLNWLRSEMLGKSVRVYHSVMASPNMMKTVAIAENGTRYLRVRMMPRGTSGMANSRMQSRMLRSISAFWSIICKQVMLWCISHRLGAKRNYRKFTYYMKQTALQVTQCSQQVECPRVQGDIF